VILKSNIYIIKIKNNFKNMKYIKTFESFELNEGLLDSPVYKLLSDKDKKEKMMSNNIPQYIKQALTFKKYTDMDTKKVIDLSDLTEEDFKKAIEMGESNKWANPDGMMLGGAPKFFKAADEKTKKAYKYIYSRIDMITGKEPHGFGSGPK
jgi:hypothetical protein